MAPLRTLTFLGWSAALVIGLPADSMGLDIPSELRQALLQSTAGNENPLSERSGQLPVIHNGIDEDTYRIGMGDVFLVNIPSMPSTVYRANVNQNCDIDLADLGILPAGPKTLSEAKKMLATFVAGKLRRDSAVYISLLRGKQATVSVTGAIDNSGTYTLPGTQRVLDAMKAAHGQLPDLSVHDYRAVIVKKEARTDTLDLFQYLFAFDDNQNPYLYPGDHIILNRALRSVHLNGAVACPINGTVPLRRGETLEELLSLFPLHESADSSGIIVLSGATKAERVQTVVSLDMAGTVVLHDRDMIVVPSKRNYPTPRNAVVRGEVRAPGTVPIVEGVTTAAEVIEACGGVTEYGDLSRAVIIRHSKMVGKTLSEGAVSMGFPPSVATTVAAVRPEMAAAFQKMNVINDYALIRYSDNQDCVLVGEDHVVVPRTEHLVYVSGNVEAPGAYAYSPGKTFRGYVRDAGGFTSRAGRANSFVMSQFAGVVVMKTDRDVAPGDIIVVPDIEEHKFMRTMFLPILQAVATTIAAVVALISVSR